MLSRISLQLRGSVISADIVAYNSSLRSEKESPRVYWNMGKLHTKNEGLKRDTCIEILHHQFIFDPISRHISKASHVFRIFEIFQNVPSPILTKLCLYQVYIFCKILWLGGGWCQGKNEK